jgi:steroid delta-isomerase
MAERRFRRKAEMALSSLPCAASRRPEDPLKREGCIKVPNETKPVAEVLRNTLDAYFAAIAARDPRRIASVFAKDCEIEDPVGSPVRHGRDEVAALFASGVAALASDVDIKVLAALPSGNSIAAHWIMTARGKAGREVKAEGIDVLQVDAHGLIVRAEGYWNASAFRQTLAVS